METTTFRNSAGEDLPPVAIETLGVFLSLNKQTVEQTFKNSAGEDLPPVEIEILDEASETQSLEKLAE